MVEDNSVRLIAEDADDLSVVSALVQDAVLKVDNLLYDQKKRRFTLEINRFQWENSGKDQARRNRVRSLLAIDSVLAVQTRAVSKQDPDMVTSPLQLQLKPDEEPPGGLISILFSGDGELRLAVEALDVTLLDSAYVWGTRHVPDHERRKS